MSKWDDAFPLTDLADVRALRQEEDARTRELTDLPDAEIGLDEAAELEAWEASGCVVFECYAEWLEWMAS